MDITELPTAESRSDMYMAFLDGVTTLTFEELPKINEYSSRMDKYLYFMCQLKNSGGGGTGSNITVENVLTSTSTVNALSALQGKTLNDKFLNYILASKLGAVNGVATLDASGKVPLSQISVVNAKIVAVANQTARLALPVSTNLTIAIQSDTNWVWGLNANADPTLTTNWIDMGSADAKVASVNGSTGVVTITADSINAVPNTRKVNNKQLNADITITLGDLLTFNNDSSYYLSGKGILEKLPSSAGTVVVDNLTSTSTTDALSANQGKILNDKINGASYYLNAKPTNVVASNADIPLTVLDGTLTYSSPYIKLPAGGTYELEADLSYRGTTYANYAWYDNSATPVQLPNSSIGNNGALNSSDQLSPSKAYASITVSSDTYVRLRTLIVNGGAVDIDKSFIKVKRVGIAGITNIPQSLIAKNVCDITGATDVTLNETWGAKQIYRRTKEGTFPSTANGYAITRLPTGAIPLNIKLMAKSTSGTWYIMGNTSSDVGMTTAGDIQAWITVTSFNSQPYKLTVDYII